MQRIWSSKLWIRWCDLTLSFVFSLFVLSVLSVARSLGAWIKLLFVHSLCDLTLMLAAYVIASWLIYSWYGYSRYARHRIQFSLPGISVTLSNSWHYCWEHCILCYCIDWLIDKCSELWMPCPWYACCIIVRFVWYLWYFGAKLEIFCHCFNQSSLISFLACIDVLSILIFLL